MQETKTRAPADEEPPAPRPSWIRIVAIAVALAMLGGALYATWQTLATSGRESERNGEPGAGASEPDFSLTDEEAIATFERLYATSASAIREQDPSLLSTVLTDGGPVYQRAQSQIAGLKKDGIEDASEFQIVDSVIDTNESDEIRLDVTFHLLTCFLNEQGKDVTKGPRALEQDSQWTLIVEDSRWQIHQGILREDRVLRGQDEGC
ncbi:MAG: hypothetical protein ACRDK3_00595 [Actinomycetota bacterium]